MLALPFFLFNLKIAFIVFSPYYKCKACSLTKKKSAETDRKKNAPANHLPGMPAHVLTSKPSPTHGICTNTYTHTCIWASWYQPCQDWDVAQCTACLVHPHNHRKYIPPCRLPNPSPVQALTLTLAMWWLTQPSWQLAGDSPPLWHSKVYMYIYVYVYIYISPAVFRHRSCWSWILCPPDPWEQGVGVVSFPSLEQTVLWSPFPRESLPVPATCILRTSEPPVFHSGPAAEGQGQCPIFRLATKAFARACFAPWEGSSTQPLVSPVL